tara:strand:+ start:268 stop:459 length:192 start_codon:yes stop_codon:yes gene_type:complete
MDLDIMDGEPTTHQYENNLLTVISNYSYENAFFKLQKHTVELSDAWWGFGKKKTFEFYEIGKS